MNMRILLAIVFVCTVPESVHCDADTEGDTSLGEESLHVLSAGQLRSLHGLIDADKDGHASFSETVTFAKTVGRQMGLRDASRTLVEVDTSVDGKVSFEEFMAHFEAISGNAEFAKQDPSHTIAVKTSEFKAADTNGDQLLDLEEFTSLFDSETHDGLMSVALQETMRLKDQNADGKLTPEEFWKSGTSEDKTVSEEQLTDFKKLDTNGDGVLELDELRPWASGHFHIEDAMKELFNDADKDGDMHVTGDELAGARDDIVSGNDAYRYIAQWIEHHEL